MLGLVLLEGLILAVHYDFPFMSFGALIKCHLLKDVSSATLCRSALLTTCNYFMYLYMQYVYLFVSCLALPMRIKLSDTGTSSVSFAIAYGGPSTMPHSTYTPRIFSNHMKDGLLLHTAFPQG